MTANNLDTITYNAINLPRIVKTPAGQLTYTYDASGRKLRTVFGTTATDYIDGIEWEGTKLNFIQTEEGRAVNTTSNGYAYEYFLKDHLGNTRSGFAANSQTTAKFVSNYYPFGLSFGQGVVTTPKNRYFYNGKELQDSSNLYDYGARSYYPVIGRWNAVDPLGEKMRGYSLYNYALNNPIRFIDYGGLYPIEIITRSYAPYKTFGPGNNWYGDSRGASVNRNASSRSSVTIRHDTETRITTAAGSSRRSHTVDGSRDAMSTTVVEENKSRGSKIDVHSAGRNEAQFGSFDIDQFTKLTANIEGNIKGNHILNISGTISGDDFPNQESIYMIVKEIV